MIITIIIIIITIKVQEEDQEIALIEQSYDAGEEKTQFLVFLALFLYKSCNSRSFASPSVCHVGSAGCG